MRQSRFTRWALFLPALLLVALTACDRGANTAGKESKAGEKLRIALVMKSLANEFFQTMEKGAREHQRAHSSEYELIANGIKDEQDVSRQAQIVEQMIAQKVNAIVIAPADSQALVGVCKRAADAGIAVVNIDNKFSDEVLKEKGINIPFVGPDNRKGARIAGEYVAKKLKAGDKVAMLEGMPGAINGIQRKLGFEEAVKAAGLTLAASQAANWETDRANRIASAILTDQPDLKALLCCNDSMALGAVAALKAAGKSGKILVAGFDDISAVEQLIREGKILCTVDQHGAQLAVYGIEYALEIARQKKTPQNRETPVDLVTAETLK
jgi:ribose transport system substrate-binding protein